MSIPSDKLRDDPSRFSDHSIAAVQQGRRPLLVEVIENVEPLDAQIGVFPKKTVPDKLRDTLFGQPEPTTSEIEAAGGDASSFLPVHTYAILDAAKVLNLAELLERSGLEHRCLFKGDAFDELKDVAPWVVRLEEDNAFTRHLFTCSEATWHLWEKEAGVYIRSGATLDEIWRHLRKFTRLQDEDGTWFHFRFWEAGTVRSFLERADWSKQKPFFGTTKTMELIAIEPNGKGTVIRPSESFGKKEHGKPFLTISREIIYARKVNDLHDYFRKLTPKRFRAIGPVGQDEFIRHLMRRASKLSITAYSEIAYLGCLMQSFGCWFDMDPAYRRLNRFLSDTEYASNPHRLDLLHQERTIFATACIGNKAEIDLRHRRAILTYLSDLHGRYERLDRATVFDIIQSAAPERAAFIGRQSLSDLFQESTRLASGFNLDMEWHIGCFTAVAYALGIGFFDDPFYPWTYRILAKENISPEERVTHLMRYAEKRLRKSILEIERHV